MRARGASVARKDPGGQGTLRTRRNLLAKLGVDVRRPVPLAACSRCQAPGGGHWPLRGCWWTRPEPPMLVVLFLIPWIMSVQSSLRVCRVL